MHKVCKFKVHTLFLIHLSFFILMLAPSCISFGGENNNVPLTQLPQDTAEISNVSLSVKGKIPAWLNGMYIRNGSGLVRSPLDSIKHWFDGLAKLDAFSIHNGQVKYTCQFIKSDAFNTYKQSNKFNFDGFAQHAEQSNFSYFDFLFGIKNKIINNANVNVAKINGHLVAVTETPLPVEFDPSLKTLGYFDYDDNLPKNYSFESAHILTDPMTKNAWNFLIDIGLFSTAYNIYTIPNGTSERKLVSTIPVDAISYMHSFALAGKYFVLVDNPLRCNNPLELAKNFIDSFAWDPKASSSIYLINRENGDYQVLQAEPLFSFHHINGFQKNNKVYVDLIMYPNANIVWDVNQYPFIKKRQNTFVRLEIDPSTHTVNRTQMSAEHFEFPRINESFVGLDYEHFYAVHFGENKNGLIKFNHKTNKHLYWSEANCYANEPLFIQKPSTNSEDDGVVLSIVNNMSTKQSFLLILDAKSFKEVARVYTPNFLFFGFHGQFFN